MERKVTWRTKRFKKYKNWSKGKNPGQAKKKKKSHRGHGCLSLVSVVCFQVEVSATSWSLVQRSPTVCGVSQMCVIMKPRRNEEAQAHIRLSSHIKKIYRPKIRSALWGFKWARLSRLWFFWILTGRYWVRTRPENRLSWLMLLVGFYSPPGKGRNNTENWMATVSWHTISHSFLLLHSALTLTSALMALS
jgi:hypothetical protein